MRIIEQNIIGKRGPENCEDLIVATRDFVGVVDGSTSKSKLPPLPDGLTGGKMAAAIVAQTVESMPAETGIQDFARRVNTRFQEQYSKSYDSAKLSRIATHKEDRWTCSAILYSRHESSIWMIGDCQGLVIGADGTTTELSNSKPYEARLAEKRAQYLEAQLASGNLTIAQVRRHDPGRDLILDEMVREMQQQNETYAVIDGFDIAWQDVKIVDGIGSGEIILASDGYPRLYPTLAATEAYLRRCLDEDPLMIKLHPATKCWAEGTQSFDDRTYIRFEI